MKHTHTLIIGGTKGTGHIIAHALGNKGHILSIIGRNMPENPVGNAEYFNLDLNNISEIIPTLKKILEKNGKINNIIFLQRYKEKLGGTDNEFNITIKATKIIIDFLKDNFSDEQDKSIILVSSIASQFIVDDQPLDYHIAKSSLNKITEYYAVILGPKKIRVNSVLPSTIFKDDLPLDLKEKYKKTNELYNSIIPLKRMVTPKDILNLVEFLISENASYITGQKIVLDGGLSLINHESLAKKLNSKALNNERNKTE